MSNIRRLSHSVDETMQQNISGINNPRTCINIYQCISCLIDLLFLANKMKYFVFLFICIVGIAYASSILKADEVLLEDPRDESVRFEEALDESERSCIDHTKECTNDRNGCCVSQGYSDITCQCYTLKKDKKRYNTEGPAERKCWCERSGYWYEKLGDWFKDKLG
ncbi:uncharacterized protein NPIL_658041 [Nephila pilipes]|uniref:Uncharacterized protein n=1 Tax=Nephila pilipes TaxID=299642 RepID=A0A8X6UGX6_NEPPI|nr:uncharacterized protein NPIL_658041 [Nephila pilipes]